MKLLIKNTFKKIKKSFGRFLSIMLIIALGVSVFIGLRESTAGMLYTADHYYDENNLMDFKITSTHGLTEDDILSIKNLANVQNVIPSYSVDVISKGKSIRIHAIEKSINNVVLIDGKLPGNNTECVADYTKYNLDDQIEFEKDDLTSFLSINKCKVVGLIKSPLYVREEKGISNVGNGKLNSFVFVPRNTFVSKYYTEVYITAKDSLAKNSYYDEYNEAIKPLNNELTLLKPIRETIRYEEILKSANEEIVRIKNEVNKEIGDSEKTLANSKKELDKKMNELTNQKVASIKKLDEQKAELLANKNLINTNLTNLGINENELDNYLKTLSDNITNLKSSLVLLDPNSNEYTILLEKITSLESNYKDLNEIANNLITINVGLKEVNNGYSTLEEEINKNKSKIELGYTEYYQALAKIEIVKQEAELKQNEAMEELKTIEKPVWYLLDRTDNSGYIGYKEDIVKVDAIAKILPIFFIVVVILMILNTLTRLIEEERTEIGILQANGFGKSSIIFSYLIYVITSGILGLAIGLTVGYSLIPQIIYSVFLARYYVPKLITVVSPLPFSLVLSITLVLMILVTIFACIKEFKEMPSSLLRPKPPKSGKKIFLENFKFLWNKLNFMSKTTIRNIFRYKKRIVMTVLGVAGCTALLTAGMGLNDSINTISKLQYEDIIKYDAMYILKDDVTKMEPSLLNIFEQNEVVNPLLINQNAFSFSFNNKTEDVYVVVPSSTTDFNNYVNLKSTVTDKKISVNNDGAIITKQLADLLNVKIGDSIVIRNSDNELFMIYISDITINYVSHYIYISKEYYEEVFKKDITYNSIIASGKIAESVNLSDYGLLTVNYTDDIIESFNSFVKGLNKIIIMIVIFASFLAFIVLYNLTIINVSERKREIATFKVLGFYDGEVAKYVYRETLILTIVGTIFGLLGGIYLHRFVIYTAQTDNILFLTKITPISFILAAVITLLFSGIVQLIINKTLKKIDMIDSLKIAE